jgi:lipopolysaccharide export system protein LptC
MNNYDQSKKARRIVSVIYILIMAVVMGGTYLSQQQKEAAGKAAQNSPDH